MGRFGIQQNGSRFDGDDLSAEVIGWGKTVNPSIDRPHASCGVRWRSASRPSAC